MAGSQDSGDPHSQRGDNLSEHMPSTALQGRKSPEGSPLEPTWGHQASTWGPSRSATFNATEFRLEMDSNEGEGTGVAEEQPSNPAVNAGQIQRVNQAEEPMETVSTWENAMEAIVRECDSALAAQIRKLSHAKREYILMVVQKAVQRAIVEVEAVRKTDAEATGVLTALGVSAQKLSELLPQMVEDVSIIRSLAAYLHCDSKSVISRVKDLEDENRKLNAQIVCLQTEQPAQVHQPAAHAAEPAQGSAQLSLPGKYSTLAWDNTRQFFQSGGKAVPIQPCSHRSLGYVHTRDGHRSSHQKTSGSRSPLSLTKSSHSPPAGTESFLSSYNDSLEQYQSETSNYSKQRGDILMTLRDVLKSQSISEVKKYDGKRSLTDFLRELDIKYPSSVWSDVDRRDILINHLEGSAKAHIRNLSEDILNGTFQQLVSELRKAKHTPCERLRAAANWKNLHLRANETVFDFCCRLKKIATTMHPNQDNDFELGSKLYECLSDWKDSYYMLAALDAPEGHVFEEVRKVALRLERTREASLMNEARQGKDQSRRVTSTKRSTDSRGENSQVGQQSQTRNKQPRACFECGENGHFAHKCHKRQHKDQHAKTGPNKSSAVKRRPAGNLEVSSGRNPDNVSFSTHLNSWCLQIKENNTDVPAAAFGKPCYCEIELLGISAKALIDTGSVISIIPVGLLKRAQRVGSDLDKLVKMVDDNEDVQVYDASGNPMEFLMRVIMEVAVQGARAAKVQLHIQHSKDELVLLGTNALSTLGVEVKFNPTNQNSTFEKSLRSEKKSLHPKLTVGWRGPYRVLKASSNSELMNLTGENEEPARREVDCLERVLPKIHVTPVKGKTLEGRRGRLRRKKSGNANKVSLEIQTKQTSCKFISDTICSRRRSNRDDCTTVDFRCPGTFEHQGQHLHCRPPGSPSEVVLKTPVPDGSSVHRLNLIDHRPLSQTHLPKISRRDLFLDTPYNTMSVKGLGKASRPFLEECRCGVCLDQHGGYGHRQGGDFHRDDANERHRDSSPRGFSHRTRRYHDSYG